MKFDWLITFRSVTYAQRAQQALKSVDMDCLLRRTPRELSSKGCGYALGIRGKDALAAAQLLRERGIAFNKVFAPGPDGKLEERAV